MCPAFSRLHCALFRLFFLLCGIFFPARAYGQSWVSTLRQGTEVRFFFDNSVRRYDLATRTWLPALTLPRGGATAFAWDAQNCYVAYGEEIYRYAGDLTGETSAASVTSSTHGLFLDGNLLIAVHSTGLYGRVTLFNRLTNAQLSTQE